MVRAKKIPCLLNHLCPYDLMLGYDFSSPITYASNDDNLISTLPSNAFRQKTAFHRISSKLPPTSFFKLKTMGASKSTKITAESLFWNIVVLKYLFHAGSLGIIHAGRSFKKCLICSIFVAFQFFHKLFPSIQNRWFLFLNLRAIFSV